jgi:hypothetical protein
MRGDCPFCPAGEATRRRDVYREETAKGALLGAADGLVFELDRSRVGIVRIFI